MSYFEVDIDATEAIEAGAPWRSVGPTKDVMVMLAAEGDEAAQQLLGSLPPDVAGAITIQMCASAQWVRRMDQKVAAGELVKVVEQEDGDEVLVYRVP